jgi:alpha-glucoside transport system substrate-binding protein
MRATTCPRRWKSCSRSEQIVADGETPWCIGLGSGAATGWPATDWVEDIMLRTQPPEVYDQWVSNEIPFTDPRVVNAIETFGMFARNDDWVQGGAGTVATTDFRDSPAGLFASPPGCYMHRQASFIPAFFPEGTVVGEDAISSTSRPSRARISATRFWVAGTLFSITDPTARRPWPSSSSCRPRSRMRSGWRSRAS